MFYKLTKSTILLDKCIKKNPTELINELFISALVYTTHTLHIYIGKIKKNNFLQD